MTRELTNHNNKTLGSIPINVFHGKGDEDVVSQTIPLCGNLIAKFNNVQGNRTFGVSPTVIINDSFVQVKRLYDGTNHVYIDTSRIPALIKEEKQVIKKENIRIIYYARMAYKYTGNGRVDKGQVYIYPGSGKGGSLDNTWDKVDVFDYHAYSDHADGRLAVGKNGLAAIADAYRVIGYEQYKDGTLVVKYSNDYGQTWCKNEIVIIPPGLYGYDKILFDIGINDNNKIAVVYGSYQNDAYSIDSKIIDPVDGSITAGCLSVPIPHNGGYNDLANYALDLGFKNSKTCELITLVQTMWVDSQYKTHIDAWTTDGIHFDGLDDLPSMESYGDTTVVIANYISNPASYGHMSISWIDAKTAKAVGAYGYVAVEFIYRDENNGEWCIEGSYNVQPYWAYPNWNNPLSEPGSATTGCPFFDDDAWKAETQGKDITKPPTSIAYMMALNPYATVIFRNGQIVWQTSDRKAALNGWIRGARIMNDRKGSWVIALANPQEITDVDSFLYSKDDGKTWTLHAMNDTFTWQSKGVDIVGNKIVTVVADWWNIRIQMTDIKEGVVGKFKTLLNVPEDTYIMDMNGSEICLFPPETKETTSYVTY